MSAFKSSLAVASASTLTAYESKTIARALRVMERVLRTPGESLSSPAMVRQYLTLRLAALEVEVFMVLPVDSQNRVLEARELFRGTLSQTAVYPREVVKAALLGNAAAVVLAHFVARHKMRLMCP